jgi:predicted amidophosphoribosyltransferase
MALGFLYTTLDALLGLVAPFRCPVCSRELERPLGCRACRLPGRARVVRRLQGDAAGPYLVLGGGSFAGRLRRAIHAVKYRQDAVALELLARQTALALPPGLRWDAIVPVPAHRVRARERGWEPVWELARRVGRRSGLPVARRLRRVRYTPALAGRHRWARQRIVRGAFRAGRPVTGRLLVLDDVGTTGATFRSCRRELLRSGALSVDLLAAALTPRRPAAGTLSAARGCGSVRRVEFRGRGSDRPRSDSASTNPWNPLPCSEKS